MAALVAGAAPARAQIEQLIDPAEITQLWFDWMVLPATSGPRLFVRTERDILQTGPTSASFLRGSSELILADGAVSAVWRDQNPFFPEEWDSDRDGFRDVVEFDAEPPSDPFNPFDVPTGVNPDVFWTFLADGTPLPVRQLGGSAAATFVRPLAAPNVKLAVAPAASRLPRPLPLFDYSTQFFITNPNNPSPEPLGLSLYAVKKNYPTPADAGAMELDIVPGSYQVQFPTVTNPFVTAGTWTSFSLVPNGTFTIGQKKPSWIVRSAESFQDISRPPVSQSWVNGRLRFDPEVSTIFKWDNIVSQGLASGTADIITIWIEDEEQSLIWPLIGSGIVVSAANPQVTLLASGLLPAISPGNPQPLEPRNGFLTLKYTRNLISTNSGDLSTVTLRVPIEMLRSYESWRIDMFPGATSFDDSISGPNADPDGDGLTNRQEYEQGSDPIKPIIGVSGAFAESITSNSATLGAEVVVDPFSAVPTTVFERGIVYAKSGTNPFPLVDGPGVNRVIADFGTLPVDTDGDGWSDDIENFYEALIGELSPNPDDPDNPLPWAENPNAFPPPALFPPDAIPGVSQFAVDVSGLSDATQYSYRGYVISSRGTFYSLPVATFTTQAAPPVTLPTVTSPSSSGLTGSSVNLSGTVTSNGNSALSQTGVVYSITATNDNPFVGGPDVTQVVSGSTSVGTFTVNVAGLAPSTTYSFRAYAINSVGTSHTTAIGTFTTPSGPVIEAPTVTDVTSSSARLGGTVTGSGGLAVLQRGVVFSSTNNNPEIGGAGVTAFAATSSGLGTFTVNVTGLQANTQYFFKAYAINSVAFSYTTVGTFTTTGIVPTLSDPTIAQVTATSAEIGASVINDGQSAITERGFVYSETSVNNDPEIGGAGVSQVAVGGTTGPMSENITGLKENTSYTFKAYAINAFGTAYGAPFAFFTTLPPLVVNNPTVDDVTDDSATLGGTVVSDSGTTVDERGVVYNTDPLTPPAIGGPGVGQVTGTGTMGPFTVPVENLDPGTQYFFRAYAINSAGTSYSDISGFTTEPFVLLGQSNIEWLDAAEQVGEAIQAEALEEQAEPVSSRRTLSFRSSASSSTDGSGTSVLRSPTGVRTDDGVAPIESGTGQAAAPFVPRFVYHKHQNELSEPISYVVEISEDSGTWKPVDQTRWQVEHTADAVIATWISPEPAPVKSFFRVKARIE